MSINGKLCKKVFIGRGYSTRAYLQVHNQQTEAVWHNGNGGFTHRFGNGGLHA